MSMRWPAVHHDHALKTPVAMYRLMLMASHIDDSLPPVNTEDYRIRYKLQSKLGPVKMPIQNIRFPKVLRPLSHLVRLNLTN